MPRLTAGPPPRCLTCSHQTACRYIHCSSSMHSSVVREASKPYLRAGSLASFSVPDDVSLTLARETAWHGRTSQPPQAHMMLL
jgi:hypothetical protein